MHAESHWEQQLEKAFQVPISHRIDPNAGSHRLWGRRGAHAARGRAAGVGGALSCLGSHLCSGLLLCHPSQGETENACQGSEGTKKMAWQNRRKGRRPEGGREGMWKETISNLAENEVGRDSLAL